MVFDFKYDSTNSLNKFDCTVESLKIILLIFNIF